jgi:hypothetical protein
MIYFINGANQLVIQGVGYFDENSYPIGVKTNTKGKVKFMIDGLEKSTKSKYLYMTLKMKATPISQKRVMKF